MAALPILENNIHQAMDWVYAIEEACQWDKNNQIKAFAALRAVLHQFRNFLPVEHAAQLGDQLPLVVRGIFFENWSPASSATQQIKKEELLESITKALYPYREVDVEEITRGVLQVLGEKLPPGELEKILKNMPEDIKDLYKSKK